MTIQQLTRAIANLNASPRLLSNATHQSLGRIYLKAGTTEQATPAEFEFVQEVQRRISRGVVTMYFDEATDSFRDELFEDKIRAAEAKAKAEARRAEREALEQADMDAEVARGEAVEAARTEAKRAAMLSNYTAQDAAALSDALEAERVETFKATLQGAPAAVGKYGHMAHKEARAASIPAYWFLLDERQQEVCEVYLEMIQRHTEEAMKEPGDSRRLKQRKDAHTAGLRSALKCYELHLLEVYEALGDQ